MSGEDFAPRRHARKTSPEALKDAIRMALDFERDSVRRNTGTFNTGRYRATAELPDYDELKDRARAIKEDAIQRMPELIDTLRASVEANGGTVFLAKDAGEATKYISDICSRTHGQIAVKSKSMTSEEIHLNPALESQGMEIVETDLGEMIIQIADEQPSHIVGPAIHRNREQISTLFKSVFQTDRPLDTGEELTKYARDILREKFLQADIGITGANGIAAETGTLLLVESEGNIRMVTQAPPVHIAIAGIEKIVPTVDDLFPFLELLGPSGTGQPLTSYTNLITPPLALRPFAFRNQTANTREFHLVLLDNGRMQMRDDPMIRQALYCIRCAACLNSCANFQNLGGHAYGGETYSGGIGAVWEAGTHGLDTAKFSELCTGCSRCVPQCPVRIDIPWLNVVLRDRMNRSSSPDKFNFVYKGLLQSEGNDKQAPLQKQFFGNFNTLAKWSSRFPTFTNWAASISISKSVLEKTVGLSPDAEMPQFTQHTFAHQYTKFRKTFHSELASPYEVIFFPDIYVNYLHPSWGLSALRILHHFGVNARVLETLPDGRAALSQGMITTASSRARTLGGQLQEYLEADNQILVVEPSVLSMFRSDYAHLLEDESLVTRFKTQTFEPLDYLLNTVQFVLQELPDDINSERRKKYPEYIFYHSHCQQRTNNLEAPTLAFLKAMGFEVRPSSVECCGMAGSFGYKREYHEVSQNVGQVLADQFYQTEKEVGKCLLVASGTSCTDQLKSLTGRPVLHPLELLDSLLNLDNV